MKTKLNFTANAMSSVNKVCSLWNSGWISPEVVVIPDRSMLEIKRNILRKLSVRIKNESCPCS